MIDYDDECYACLRCGENMSAIEWKQRPVCSDCKAEDAWYQSLADEYEQRVA